MAEAQGSCADGALHRRRLLVEGRVQGVGYRAACAREAARLGLSGWVRNLRDGRVEVVGEGSLPSLQGLCAWCATGPRLARVLGVEAIEEEPQGIEGFAVVS